MGEKKKSNQGKQKNDKEDAEKKQKNDKEDAEKKDSSKNAVVLKIQMHCHGCAKKVIQSIKRFEIEGVEDVKADSSVNKVLVFGKVMDPLKLREKVESKTKKKVDLVSPAPNNKKEKQASQTKDKKPEEKKVTTVTLKTKLHCEGCTQKIRRNILKVKGVEGVTVNKLQDLVIVKGSMNVNELQTHLKKKYKRSVDIIPPKKDGGGGEKKDKASKNGGGDEKKSEEKGGEAKAKAKAKEKEAVKVELPNSKMEYFGQGYGSSGYSYPGNVVEYVHAPQLFSDENPNACSVM